MASQGDWADIGRRVRESRISAKLSQDELGRRMGLERSVIAKIESGSRRIDAVELMRLSSCLDLPLDHFLGTRPAVLSHRTAPLADEATNAGRDLYRLESALESWVRDVRQLIDIAVLEPAPLRLHPGTVSTETAAREAARWLREEQGHADRPIPSLMTVCERAGLQVAVVDLPGDGASLVDGGFAAAVVSRLGDPGRRRSTAAHELGHVVLGDEYSSDLGVHASRGDREAVIEAFAAEFLLPSSVFTARRTESDRAELIRLAAEYRTSWSLAVWQAVRAGVLANADASAWLQQRPTKAELMDAIGWAPQPDLESVRVPPSFAHGVVEAFRRSQITSARAVEMMRGQISAADLPSLGDEDLRP